MVCSTGFFFSNNCSVAILLPPFSLSEFEIILNIGMVTSLATASALTAESATTNSIRFISWLSSSTAAPRSPNLTTCPKPIPLLDARCLKDFTDSSALRMKV